MQTVFIDTRPKAPSAIFSMEVLSGEKVRLRNVESKRTHVEDSVIFRRHYERMSW